MGRVVEFIMYTMLHFRLPLFVLSERDGREACCVLDPTRKAVLVGCAAARQRDLAIAPLFVCLKWQCQGNTATVVLVKDRRGRPRCHVFIAEQLGACCEPDIKRKTTPKYCCGNHQRGDTLRMHQLP